MVSPAAAVSGPDPDTEPGQGASASSRSERIRGSGDSVASGASVLLGSVFVVVSEGKAVLCGK